MVMPGSLHVLHESVKRRAATAVDVAVAMDMTEVSDRLSATRKRGHAGKTLIKAGVALIAIPDPISDVPGAALALTGVAIAKFSDCVGIQDLKDEVAKTLSELSI